MPQEEGRRLKFKFNFIQVFKVAGAKFKGRQRCEANRQQSPLFCWAMQSQRRDAALYFADLLNVQF